jgi:hypothetical protein
LVNINIPCIANATCGVLISGISLFAGDSLPLPDNPSLFDSNLIPNGNFANNNFWKIYNIIDNNIISSNSYPKIENNILQFKENQDPNQSETASIVNQNFILPDERNPRGCASWT